MKKILITLAACYCMFPPLICDEDRARENQRETEQRETDRIFRDNQEKTGASEYEKNADRKSWTPESDSRRERDSRAEPKVGTFGPPDRDK